jgi:catechol 2,3-dioxygenase-like lactoylglutathione lyase family enzyme
MPQIGGLLESSLWVDDVERAAEFYRRLFTFETLVEDQRICALSVEEKQVLLLFRKGGSTEVIEIPGGKIPPFDGSGQTHVAFSIPAEELAGWEARLSAEGVEIESRVRWERGGQSVYFRDPDGNLVELVTPGCWRIY